MIDMMLTERLNSGYFNSQHCSTQWRSFIQVFVEEIYQTAGDEDARAFLRHIGTRLAAMHPVPLYDSIEELEKSMNLILSSMDWGWVKMEMHDLSLVFYHGAFPLPSYGKKEAEREALVFSALLEGLYHGWMVALGGNSEIAVRTQKAIPGQVFELVYAKLTRNY